MATEQPGSLSLKNGVELQRFAPLANLTTWRVGGTAEWLAEPSNLEEVKQIIDWAFTNKIPCQVLGAGSNLLINDSGINGLSLCMRKLHGSKLDQKTGIVEAVCGEPIPTLARRAARAGLKGLEWAVGIPGTAGGAAVMNAGAQGSCMAEILESVLVMPLNGQDPFEITCDELEYSYRNSLLQKEKLIVLSIRLRLEPGHDCKELNTITNKNLSHRKNTQPYHLPTCGSVFRNPEPLKAGRIIEELGLKGLQIGGAKISTMHGNFIINNGEASAADILSLIALIQEKVLEAHGVLLHPEVKQLGFDSND